jgi:hypothetical protein
MKKIKLFLLFGFIFALSFSCNFDIGDWDISRSADSRRNINAFVPVNFFERVYPLTFGTSTRPANCYIISEFQWSYDGNIRTSERVPEGSIEIASVGGSGKIAGSEDGITFYFREVPVTKNFIMEADFLIKSFGASTLDRNDPNRGTPEDETLDDNGQGAWGIMVRDFVPQISRANRSTTMPAWDDSPHELIYINADRYALAASDHRGDSNMIMAGGVKRGVRCYWREGIKRNPDVPLTNGDSGNPTTSGEQDFSDFRFYYLPRELGDYSIYTNSAGVPTMAARPDFPKWGTTYRVRLEKTNNSYKYRMIPLDDYYIDPITGEEVLKPEVSGEVPLFDIAESVNRDHYYVGLFASRNARVWVSNVKYWEADAADCAPALPFIATPMNATLEVVSPAIYGGENFLYVRSNVKGTLEITQNGRRIPSSVIQNDWYDGRDYGSAMPLTLFTVPIFPPNDGDNVFNLIFYPENTIASEWASQGFSLASSAAVRRTFLLTKKFYQGGTGYIFVSPSGSPNGTGSRGSPLDIQTAVNHCQPGQTVILMDGTYIFERVFVIARYNNGRFGEEKIMRAENPGKVFLDWNKNETLAQQGILRGQGFLLDGNYWILDGFHVRNTPNKVKGIVIGGKNNVLSRLAIYNNGDTGLQISGSSSEPRAFWPSGNRIEFSESFNNRDLADTDADGFAAKLTSGRDNEFWWCVAHSNCDDGWDLFAKKDTGATGITRIFNSIAYNNGYLLNGYEPSAGHNGYKMGGEGISVRHEIHQSLAFRNKGFAYSSNSNPSLLVFNSTAIGSGGNNMGGINIYSGDSNVAANGNAFNSIGSLTIRPILSNAVRGTLPPNTDYSSFLVSGNEVGYPFGEQIERWDGNGTVCGKKFIRRNEQGFFILGDVYRPGIAGEGATEFFDPSYVYPFPNPYTRVWP